ncbi:MAG TPA: DUF2934 domain-containing protein [Steroidobacteraceae bacterium]
MATRRRPDSNRGTPRGATDEKITTAPDSASASERRRSDDLQANPKEKAFEDSSTRTRDQGGLPNATIVDEHIFHEERELRIAELAYSKAQQRGFAPGRELDDWLEAEREIDASFARAEHRPAAH